MLHKKVNSMSDKLSLITPDIYQAFKTAIETGKWPDGRLLTSEQKDTCMSAMIAYEHHHLDKKEHIGYIDRGHKSDGDLCDDTDIIKFK